MVCERLDNEERDWSEEGKKVKQKEGEKIKKKSKDKKRAKREQK